MSEEIYISNNGTLERVQSFPTSLEAVVAADVGIEEYNNYVYTIIEHTTKSSDDAIDSTYRIFRTYSNEADAIEMCKNFNDNRSSTEDWKNLNDKLSVMITTYTYVKNEFFGEVLEREQTWH